MASSVLSIIAALLPFILDWIGGRREESPYEVKQKLRRAVVAGDIDYISSELDRLREKAARRDNGRL